MTVWVKALPVSRSTCLYKQTSHPTRLHLPLAPADLMCCQWCDLRLNFLDSSDEADTSRIWDTLMYGGDASPLANDGRKNSSDLGGGTAVIISWQESDESPGRSDIASSFIWERMMKSTLLCRGTK